MPSLKALQEFKNSFTKIGGESESRLDQNLPEDDLPLPDHEPAPIPELQPVSEDTPAEEFAAESLGQSAEDLLNLGDIGDLLGGSASAQDELPDSGGLTDGNGLTDLLDNIPDEFDTPNALLDGLTDTLESTEMVPLETSAEIPDESLPGELSSELSSIDDLQFPDLEAEPETVTETSPEAGFDNETVTDTAGMDDELSMDLPEFADFGESPDITEQPESSESTDSSMSAESLEDSLDLGGEFIDEVQPEDELSAAEDSASETDAEAPLELDSSFELDSLPENVETSDSDGSFELDSLPETTGSEESEDSGVNDFTLPGIDDVYSPKRSPAANPEVDDLLGEPDEILLSEEETARLRKTLSSYPLNLRIACQELITEEVIAPDQMSNLIRLLKTGASAKETAALAGKILGKTITIPRSFEKMTGEQLETEQASFAYIFIHNFLPVLRTMMAVATVLVCLGYLIWNFIYLPAKAESIYRRGYERIAAGEYGRSRDLFREAFGIHQKKEWFYRYAEAYRDERQFLFAEEKYDELLAYTAFKNKNGIPEKRAVLDYAELETYYLRNYSKADRILRNNILDFSLWDREALLALGDNNLAWGEVDYERFEEARKAYAILIERYGRNDLILERMLKYFIRTDNLGETLPLQNHFMSSERRKISAETLAELGGYYLQKQTEEIRGVPNVYLDRIGGIREILLRAVRTDPLHPESYYHLSRYYFMYGSYSDEEMTLGRAIQAFDIAKLETPKRLGYRIEALRRYAEIHIQRGEFFRGEEYLIKGAGLYENGVARRVIPASPQYGRIYADLGDLEFFIKDGNAAAALTYYRRSEQNGYIPPEIRYRMGAAYYQLRQWTQALDYFAAASFPLPYNQRILYALGNTSYLRGNYFAAQGYYDRLLEILEADKSRFPLIYPSNDSREQYLTERIMVVQNNLAVTLEALTLRTGNTSYRARALGLYSESERAWDILTRNPGTMERLRPSPDIIAPGVNPAYLNVQNSLYPIQGYEPLFFMRIDKDLLEPSLWDEIAPPGFRMAEGISAGR